MDREKAMMLKKYESVWQRVSPQEDPFALPAEQEEKGMEEAQERLLEKMAAELGARDAYLALAGRGGAGKRVFERLALQEARHARKLAVMWFLLTARKPPRCIGQSAPLPQRKQDALRQRYREECISAEEYEAMARRARGEAAEVFSAMAREEREHAAALRYLLEQLL